MAHCLKWRPGPVYTHCELWNIFDRHGPGFLGFSKTIGKSVQLQMDWANGKTGRVWDVFFGKGSCRNLLK